MVLINSKTPTEAREYYRKKPILIGLIVCDVQRWRRSTLNLLEKKKLPSDQNISGVHWLSLNMTKYRQITRGIKEALGLGFFFILTNTTNQYIVNKPSDQQYMTRQVMTLRNAKERTWNEYPASVGKKPSAYERQANRLCQVTPHKMSVTLLAVSIHRVCSPWWVQNSLQCKSYVHTTHFHFYRFPSYFVFFAIVLKLGRTQVTIICLFLSLFG